MFPLPMPSDPNLTAETQAALAAADETGDPFAAVLGVWLGTPDVTTKPSAENLHSPARGYFNVEAAIERARQHPTCLPEHRGAAYGIRVAGSDRVMVLGVVPDGVPVVCVLGELERDGDTVVAQPVARMPEDHEHVEARFNRTPEPPASSNPEAEAA